MESSNVTSDDLDISVMGPGDVGLQPSDSEGDSSTAEVGTGRGKRVRKKKVYADFIGPVGRKAPPPSLVNRKKGEGKKSEGTSDFDISVRRPSDMGLQPSDTDESMVGDRDKRPAVAFRGPTGRALPPPSLLKTRSMSTGQNCSELSIMRPGDVGLQPSDTDESVVGDKRPAVAFRGPTGRAPPPPALLTRRSVSTVQNSSELSIMRSGDLRLQPNDTDVEMSNTVENSMPGRKKLFMGLTDGVQTPPLFNRTNGTTNRSDFSTRGTSGFGMESDTDLDDVTRGKRFLRWNNSETPRSRDSLPTEGSHFRQLHFRQLTDDVDNENEISVPNVIQDESRVDVSVDESEPPKSGRNTPLKDGGTDAPLRQQDLTEHEDQHTTTPKTSASVSVLAYAKRRCSVGPVVDDVNLPSICQVPPISFEKVDEEPKQGGAPTSSPTRKQSSSSKTKSRSINASSGVSKKRTKRVTFAHSDFSTRGTNGFEMESDTDLEVTRGKRFLRRNKSETPHNSRNSLPIEVIEDCHVTDDVDEENEISGPESPDAIMHDMSGDVSVDVDETQKSCRNTSLQDDGTGTPHVTRQNFSEHDNRNRKTPMTSGISILSYAKSRIMHDMSGDVSVDETQKSGRNNSLQDDGTDTPHVTRQDFSEHESRNPKTPMTSGISVLSYAKSRCSLVEPVEDANLPSISQVPPTSFEVVGEEPRHEKASSSSSARIGRKQSSSKETECRSIKSKPSVSKRKKKRVSLTFVGRRSDSGWGPNSSIMKGKGKVLYNSNLVSQQCLNEALRKYSPGAKLTSAQKSSLLQNLNAYIEQTFDKLCDDSPAGLFYGVWGHDQLMDRLKDDELLEPSLSTGGFVKLIRETVGEEEAKDAAGYLYPNPGRSDIGDIYTEYV